MGWIATLPMYDEPELRPHVDAFYQGVAERLAAAGVTDVPVALSREVPCLEAWRHPRLLLGQTCGYPLVTSLRGRVRVIGAPCHGARGCGPGTYRSFVVVRQDAPFEGVGDLRGARCAVNEAHSHSGMNALRALVAPWSRRGRFFGEILWSGRHRDSLRMVRGGEADVAAIDCVLHSLLLRIAPEELGGLRVLTQTAEVPALPYVTAAAGAEVRLPALRQALQSALEDPRLQSARDALQLTRFVAADEQAYAPILAMEAEAAARGYGQLA